jgi:hypothetical protein
MDSLRKFPSWDDAADSCCINKGISRTRAFRCGGAPGMEGAVLLPVLGFVLENRSMFKLSLSLFPRMQGALRNNNNATEINGMYSLSVFRSP